MNIRQQFFIVALAGLGLAGPLRAQDISSSNTNVLYVPFLDSTHLKATAAGPPTASNQGPLPATDKSNFQGMGLVSGSTCAIAGSGIAVPYVFPANYPNDANAGTKVGARVVVTRSRVGGVFASGVPRYSMGDEITVPLVDASGAAFAGSDDAAKLAAAKAYWRAQPVTPGEVVNGASYSVTVTSSSTSSNAVTVASVPTGVSIGSVLLGQAITAISGTSVTLAGNASNTYSTSTSVTVNSAVLVPAYSVLVTASSSGSKQVTVTNGSATGMVVGATLLGQPITVITGNTVTLAGNANQTIAASAGIASVVTPALSYYYSPHSEKVYASQPGRVTLTWVTVSPVSGTAYGSRLETFAVSSSTLKKIRTIYWTEGNFDGPQVTIGDGRITTVSPIYNSSVPQAVDQEVAIPGYVPITENLSTLSFGKFNGKGILHAYNVEGRILIEYLGNLRAGSDVYVSLGTEVVDLVRAPAIFDTSVNLGQPLRPHDLNAALIPSPVISTQLAGDAYYATTSAPQGGLKYVAERETSSANAPDNGLPSDPTAAYNKVRFYWLQAGDYGIQWPMFQDRYWLRWSPNLADYVHYTVDPAGSTAANGMQFTDGALPTLVYQDDPNQSEAKIDNSTQRFYVTFGADLRNRSLLKFSGTGEAWYVNLYSQADSRSQALASTASTSSGVTTVTVTGVAGTTGLEVGMTVTGADGSFAGTIASITDGRHFVLSQAMANGSSNLTYTVEEGGGAQIVNATAKVGTRIDPPADHEIAGHISSGTGYYPAGYLDPLVVGAAAANAAGAIIPVNAVPNKNLLTVRWYKKIAAPSDKFKDLYVPGKIGRYTVSYPTAPSQIVIAQGVGTGDLSAAEAAGSVYVQNDFSQPGYNPNEEHAFMIGGRAYALRDDLNVYPSVSGYATGNYTSDPYVLVAYTDTNDQRPKMHAYQVVRSNATYDFSYTATAGTLLVKPYPLPLMATAMVGTGIARKGKDVEILTAVDAPTNTLFSSNSAYSGFTFEDRKGFKWIHRGPHGDPKALTSTATGSCTITVSSTSGLKAGMSVSGAGITGTATLVSITDATHYVLSQAVTADSASWSYSPALLLKLYYTSKDGFYLPGATRTATQPPVGTVLPFLRAANRSGSILDINQIDADPAGLSDQNDAPLMISYRPAWPTNVPTLKVAETLTLPNHNLPQLRGQKSAQVFYQQSIALDASNSLVKNSVTLHDPTRQKMVALDAVGVGMTQLPDVLKTTSYQGKTYFQGLPPSLQQRLFVDPTVGAKGTLYLIGRFHDEIVGDKYLDLNVLTAAENALVKGLIATSNSDYSKWAAAIDKLSTRVETFKPNPAKFGSYMVDSTKNQDVGVSALASLNSEETAQDSYAVTATGQGTGYVTMVFGNSGNTDRQAAGDPVDIQVFKVANQLYTGDLKVITSSNPLDEQVTLRHSADFAAKPEDYEFDWRWHTGDPSAPATYSNVMTPRIGDAGTSNHWTLVRDPGTVTTSAAQYLAAGVAVDLPRSENVRPVTYLIDGQNQSTTVDDAASYTNAEIAAGVPVLSLKSNTAVDFSAGVPAKIVFSAVLGDYDGFVLYVNGKTALAYHAPSPQFASVGASTGLTLQGLGKQFSVDPNGFSAGPNTIEVAVYTTADANTRSALDFKLEAAQETDLVASTWQPSSDFDGNKDTINTNTAIVGGATSNPFGGPQFVLNDRWFTMRYRPKVSANNVLGTPWSRWMEPQFTEGWIKRVLAAINPFEQRVKDLYNNAVNTDVSMLTQAGTRWEGNLALNMDNINDNGLIAIYETVLNRAKSMSIDANTNDPDTNNALILAAGYLNDLYTILGNEAYADAANPTISLDAGAVNTSRFSFEGQVASSLDEEMALLRGRDDSVSPGVKTAPFYNRLVWNYTHGINSGEAIYATNYNIKEKVGSSTANGVIDESDAQRMFPQGHGDAYGHYLTALTGYYRLLWNANFTWKPSAEAVTVLGVPVTVDFQDERKFAAAASHLASTAEQICALTYRQNYQDSPSAGWTQFRDTTPTRRWGLDEQVSRSTQGALYHWAVANALVPDVDNYHTGVQKIDRSTVPELALLPISAAAFQTTIDNANARLNPLGLSSGSITFDIDPSFTTAAGNQGNSHFQQIYGRALRSLNNAAGAFNQAAAMSGSLRSQTNQVDDYSTSIAMQETAYVNQLIDIYGRPYSGEIGAGKLYAQGYAGPDLIHWFIVDRPNDLVDTSKSVSVTLKEANQIQEFTGNSIADVVSGYNAKTTVTSHTVNINPSQYVQYNDVWQAGGLGSRTETGELESALQDTQQSWLAIYQANVGLKKSVAEMNHKAAVFNDTLTTRLNIADATDKAAAKRATIEKVQEVLTEFIAYYAAASDYATMVGEATAEMLPKEVGLSNDATSTARGAIKIAASVVSFVAKNAETVSTVLEMATRHSLDKVSSDLQGTIEQLQLSHEDAQMAYEFDIAYREVVTQSATLMQLTINHQRALQKVNNVVAKGGRILAEREVFRQRAAAIVQGYRTKDMTFRTFRNEALEQYRSLFDLAGRYTYLAAKAYDYETGLLGSPQGQSVFAKIVASRGLGDLTGGVPQSTTSTLGDAGLAGTMAQLNADFSVAEGRLGINNPDYYGTVFSLRTELFRLLDVPTMTSDDVAWQQTLEQHIVTNVLNDADVASQCRNIKKSDGSAVPGIIIPFSTRIAHGQNFFGLDLVALDHSYSASSYATKISNAGIVLPGYIGMDKSISDIETTTANSANALSANPYVYLIPCGNDSMRAPPLGDTDIVRTWSVQDQALPLPYNLGASNFNSSQFFDANGTLSEQPWIIRKHQAFRAVEKADLFLSGSPPLEFSSSRLIGRSAWNSKWKIVIPAYTLMKDEQTGLSRFAASVSDIQLYLRTYSHSGN